MTQESAENQPGSIPTGRSATPEGLDTTSLGLSQPVEAPGAPDGSTALESSTSLLDATRAWGEARLERGTHADVGIVAADGDVGIAAGGAGELGKGWTLAGAAQWFRRKGYAAALWLGWRPK